MQSPSETVVLRITMHLLINNPGTSSLIWQQPIPLPPRQPVPSPCVPLVTCQPIQILPPSPAMLFFRAPFPEFYSGPVIFYHELCHSTYATKCLLVAQISLPTPALKPSMAPHYPQNKFCFQGTSPLGPWLFIPHHFSVLSRHPQLPLLKPISVVSQTCPPVFAHMIFYFWSAFPKIHLSKHFLLIYF